MPELATPLMADPAQILVVEDEETIREVLVTALQDEGYAVRDVGDGQRALDVLGAWTPNLIILDLMLPVLDGWDFLRESQRLGLADKVPVVVLSASRRGTTVTEMFPACAAVIAKPFDLGSLLDTIERLVRS
jgi:two-component system chemotaxis response regulator CheY